VLAAERYLPPISASRPVALKARKTSPEQSYVASPVVPYLYGLPIWARAKLTTTARSSLLAAAGAGAAAPANEPSAMDRSSGTKRRSARMDR
jgi:hypothetical protein